MRNGCFSLSTGEIHCIVVGWGIVCKGVTVDVGDMGGRYMFGVWRCGHMEH